MSTPKSVVSQLESPPVAALAGFVKGPDFGPDLLPAEGTQRALLNILEDFADEKSGLEHGQRAMLNILDDFDSQRARMEGAQRAVLNILEDSVEEKTQLQAAQGAMLNILDDFSEEKGRLVESQSAVLNILDDFASEKSQLQAAQGAMVNILDDFSEEKTRLEETQRAVLNILDDFESEKDKVQLVNHQLAQEIEERKRVEMRVQGVNIELLAANKELEAFSYSVSHDLRAPLRSIDGFSLALLDDYADKLDDEGKDYLRRVRAATQRMGVLIDDLLNLSRVTRAEMRLERADLEAIARSIGAELQKTQGERSVEFRIGEGLEAFVDSHLMSIVLENLLGNAWKFTSKRASACIEFNKTHFEGRLTYYIRDNGAGFDPAYAHRLFGAFQRLHDKNDFPGTGVGLATVQRIIHRHGGRIWAESAVDRGATFFFTLSERKHGELSNA
jgi:signal transduction histidine kinase